MRNFRCRGVAVSFVGAAPCGRPPSPLEKGGRAGTRGRPWAVEGSPAPNGKAPRAGIRRGVGPCEGRRGRAPALRRRKVRLPPFPPLGSAGGPKFAGAYRVSGPPLRHDRTRSDSHNSSFLTPNSSGAARGLLRRSPKKFTGTLQTFLQKGDAKTDFFRYNRGYGTTSQKERS